MDTQVDHLLTLARSDTEAGRWLACAVREWCDGKPWTTATGIKPSQVSRAIRDQHLRRAGDMLGRDPLELHRLAARFESVLWPRWSRSGMPADAGAINALLYQARQAGPLPSSTRQFRRILK